jgi:hypothetical protein
VFVGAAVGAGVHDPKVTLGGDAENATACCITALDRSVGAWNGRVGDADRRQDSDRRETGNSPSVAHASSPVRRPFRGHVITGTFGPVRHGHRI